MNKKLYRSESNKMIAGVFGGLADYTGIDVSILRILFVIGFLLGFGTLAIVYILWVVIVPSEKDVNEA
jgi:phage shock protein C